MQMNLKKGDAEYDAYADLFRFHKDFGVPEKEDGYWTELITKAEEISRKYRGTSMEQIVDRHLITVMAKVNGDFQRMKGAGE